MSDRDGLAELVSAASAAWADGGAASPIPGSLADYIAACLTDAGYRKAEPVWEGSLRNDGAHEYTETGSCDGSEVWKWKRLPRLTYDSGNFPWQEIEHNSTTTQSKES